MQFPHQNHRGSVEAAADGEMGSGRKPITRLSEACFELLRHNTALQPTPLTRRG